MANVIGDGILGTFKSSQPNSVFQSMNAVIEGLITVTPENFGAVGDGETDDTDAFINLSAAINTAGGGIIELLSGKTYRVGRQSAVAGSFGLGYAYNRIPEPGVINLLSCTRPVIIRGNGSSIKLNDGLRYGSFDPITGAIFNPTLPFFNDDYRALISTLVRAQSCVDVSVENLELDGNDAEQIIGGVWGEGGYQVPAYATEFLDCGSLSVKNVYAHHALLDGLYIADTNGNTELFNKPAIFENCISEYNARQGMSIVGGKGITLINCRFNHTGRGEISSEPGAGLDIETEPLSNEINNVYALNCEFVNNVGPGVLSAPIGLPSPTQNYHVKFEHCRIVGTTFQSIILYNSHFYEFNHCEIVSVIGLAATAGNADNPALSTKFTKCYITDDPTHGYGGISLGSTFLLAIEAKNTVWEDCTVRTTKSGFLYCWNKGLFKNMTFLTSTGTETFPSGSKFGDFMNKDGEGASTLDNCTFSSDMINQPVTGYYVDFAPETRFLTAPVRFGGSNRVRPHSEFGPPLWWGVNFDLTPKLTDFGAVGDGVTDNAAAFDLIRHTSLLYPTPFTCVMPAGSYVVGSEVIFRDVNNFSLIGDGIEQTKILSTNNGNVFKFENSASSPTENITLSGFTIEGVGAKTTGTGIGFVGNVGFRYGNIAMKDLSFRNLYQSIFLSVADDVVLEHVIQNFDSDVATLNAPTFHFALCSGLRFFDSVLRNDNTVANIAEVIRIEDDCEKVSISDTYINSNALSGIKIMNSGLGSDPKEIRIDRVKIENSTTSNILLDAGRDVRITDSAFLDSVSGIYIRGGNGISLNGCTISTNTVRGIGIDGSIGTLTDVSIINCSSVNNTVYGIETGSFYPIDGLRVVGCQLGNTDIYGNVTNQTTGIRIFSSGHDTIVSNCNFFDVTTQILNESTSNSILIANNTPAIPSLAWWGYPVLLAAGDTTPSVGTISSYYQCSNVAPTSITYFDNGIENQEILVRLDSNTIIVHNTAFIRLKGAVNVSGVNFFNFISFILIGGVWFEVYRNF